MASTNALLMRVSSNLFRGPRSQLVPKTLQEANGVYAESGAVLPLPPKTRFAKLKVLAVTIPGLYLGAVLSKSAAEYMEENDIFVPADDDWPYYRKYMVPSMESRRSVTLGWSLHFRTLCPDLKKKILPKFEWHTQHRNLSPDKQIPKQRSFRTKSWL